MVGALGLATAAVARVRAAAGVDLEVMKADPVAAAEMAASRAAMKEWEGVVMGAEVTVMAVVEVVWVGEMARAMVAAGMEALAAPKVAAQVVTVDHRRGYSPSNPAAVVSMLRQRRGTRPHPAQGGPALLPARWAPGPSHIAWLCHSLDGPSRMSC